MFKLFHIVLVSLAVSCSLWAEQVPAPADADVRYHLSVPEGGLAWFLKRPAISIPMVSHHRGGPMPGFPENSIEAMDNALAYGYGLMEVDVAQLKDGTLILMHDDTFERTTTGQGEVRQQTWEQAMGLYLLDEEGTTTTFRIPRLETVLKWAIGRTILTLDIKRGVDFAKVAALVRQTGAQDYVAAISYTMEQAIAFHRLAPEMPLSIGLFSSEDIRAFDRSGIPDHLVIAWTGTSLRDEALYRSLQSRGWRVIVGTLGRPGISLDTQIRDGATELTYREIVARGADIIATDRFWAVQQEIGNPKLFIYTKQKLAH